jgi:hypothetical protein
MSLLSANQSHSPLRIVQACTQCWAWKFSRAEQRNLVQFKQSGEGLLRGDAFAGPLAAKFFEKIILLHAGSLAQQFEQGIL